MDRAVQSGGVHGCGCVGFCCLSWANLRCCYGHVSHCRQYKLLQGVAVWGSLLPLMGFLTFLPQPCQPLHALQSAVWQPGACHGHSWVST